MSPRRNIYRNIDCSTSRKDKSVPTIGQVSRLRDVDVILSRKRTRRSGRHSGEGGSSSSRSRKNRVVLAWSALFGLIAFLMIGVTASSWMESRKQNGEQVERPATRNIVESGQLASKVTPLAQEEAVELVKRAMSMRDPEAVDAVFAHSEASVEEVAAFMRDLKERDGTIAQISWAGNMDRGGQQIEGVYVQFAGRETSTARMAMLTPDESGGWKVDFEAFARFCRPSWGEILKRNFETARVRVTISKYSYYNGPFRNDDHWMCVAMASPDADRELPEDLGFLCGYCKVGSPQATAMERIFSGGSLVAQGVERSRAILEIRPVEGGESRQFEITRVLSADWVMPPVALDEPIR